MSQNKKPTRGLRNIKKVVRARHEQPLWWVCKFCGDPDPVDTLDNEAHDGGYIAGDTEPCCHCGVGTAVVLPRDEAHSYAKGLKDGTIQRKESYPK